MFFYQVNLQINRRGGLTFYYKMLNIGFSVQEIHRQFSFIFIPLVVLKHILSDCIVILCY